MRDMLGAWFERLFEWLAGGPAPALRPVRADPPVTRIGRTLARRGGGLGQS